MFQEPVTVLGAGRTDSGVHALGQVAHFKTSHPMDAATLLKALNAQLPGDIAVLSVEEVPEEFHSMIHAKSKTYSYFLLHREEKLPFLNPWTWRVWSPLDLDAMGRCLELIEGEHDFRAFCASDSTARSTIRHIERTRLQALSLRDFGDRLAGIFGLAEWVAPPLEGPSLIAFHFKGRGFLKHMVRNLVGTLVEVGQGKTTVEGFKEILESRDRRRAGKTAPARGLFLVKVDYEK
jgi:tRNA pseudouridine38-40 synthase